MLFKRFFSSIRLQYYLLSGHQRREYPLCVYMCVQTKNTVNIYLPPNRNTFLDWITRERVTQHTKFNECNRYAQNPFTSIVIKNFVGIWFGFLYVFLFFFYFFTFTVPISSPWIYLSVENELLTKSTAVAAAAALILSLHASQRRQLMANWTSVKCDPCHFDLMTFKGVCNTHILNTFQQIFTYVALSD